jgi:spermidine/putrescine transport system permease protein
MVFAVSFLTRGQMDFYTLNATFDNYLRLLEPRYLKIFINSAVLAGITTICCILAAFPFSYILSRMKTRRKSMYLLLIIVPFWTSALIRTYAIKTILAANGLINTVLLKTGLISAPFEMLYTKGAVVAGLVYTLLPYMILPLYASLEKLDNRYIEAAHDLGAGRLSTLVRIIIPLSMPGIIAGSLLVFLPALGLYYIPDFLGGAKGILIGNLINDQFRGQVLNWPFGAAVSVMLTLIMGILLVVNYKTVKTAAKKGVL